MSKLKALDLDPTLDPWAKQSSETQKKYTQFLTFLNLGLTRTLTKAAENLTLSYGYVRILAIEYRWQERAAAWDDQQQQQYAAELEEERRLAAKTDAKILRAMTGLVGQALPHMRPDTMTWSEFARLAETTMRLRRGLFGDPMETIAVSGPGGDPLTVQMQMTEFAGLPPEQRNLRLAELAAAVARRVQAVNGSDDDEDDAGHGEGGGQGPGVAGPGGED